MFACFEAQGNLLLAISTISPCTSSQATVWAKIMAKRSWLIPKGDDLRNVPFAPWLEMPIYTAVDGYLQGSSNECTSGYVNFVGKAQADMVSTFSKPGVDFFGDPCTYLYIIDTYFSFAVEWR